jgi:Xaa-Pro aminopeptidase
MFKLASDFEFHLEAKQQAINEFGFDGWLLCDFRGSNVLSARVLGFEESGSRRFYYFIPANGPPQKLVHKIEPAALDHLPGEKTTYLTWQELHAGLQKIVRDSKKIAMEYSPENANPYVSTVDAGTVELVRKFGPEIASSGNLIQYFEARWSDQQWQLHLEADKINQDAFEMAFETIADSIRTGKPVREFELQSKVMEFYSANNMTTYSPPIVAVNGHAGDPHYSPTPGTDKEIKSGDVVLLDMWAKMDIPNGVYTDLTKMGYVGDEVPDNVEQIFGVVRAGRDAGIECVKSAFAENRPLQGWEVDRATRNVIDEAGYGEFFIHRTGHNIGQETHGNGAHMDDLETKEDRLVLPRTCFSIEPGIYMPEKDLGFRSEINVYVDENSQVHVTGGVQTKVRPIMA